MPLAYLPTDVFFFFYRFLKAILLDPEAVSWITLAALSLHNYLRAQATDTYIPPALVDIEDDDHHITPGSWRSDTTLQSVLAGRDRNATEQRDRLKDYFSSPAGSVSWQEQML